MTTAEPQYSARTWLARQLADGQPHVAGGLFTRAAEAGYSQMQLRRAARALGVKVSEACMGAKSNAPKVVIWRLAAPPPDAA